MDTYGLLILTNDDIDVEIMSDVDCIVEIAKFVLLRAFAYKSTEAPTAPTGVT